MKSGYIAVIGRANAGKSTLINVMVGEKVSIVSPKPQTTRDRILGILNEEDCQMIFVDTPGIYKAKTALDGIMQKTAKDSAEDVDLVLYLADAHNGLAQSDVDRINAFKENSNVIVVLTKVDIMQKELLAKELLRLNDVKVPIVPISARKGSNLKELKKVMLSYLPEGERIFSEDVVSDKSYKFMIGEIMREKLLLLFDAEIPHGVAVVINKFEKRDSGNLYDVDLDIVCDKQNHKSIIIGKQGSALKKAAAFARKDMEKMLGAKVFLTTYVKVKDDWKDRNYLIKEFGYFDER